MSWFKRRGERKSHDLVTQLHSDADPSMKLEVFQNHWKQVWTVISCQDKKVITLNGQATGDGVEAVLCHLEQMVTLLVNEDGCAGGLPGPILQFSLDREILEKFCSWCTINISAHQRLWMLQLRLFELIISQSKQILLVHRAVMKPLLRLLIDIAESPDVCNGELEFRLVLVLHQICICISQQSLILDSFFSTDTDHGPARFLTFSLLIPYIHREGDIGPKARDALLLIMTLSARHPHIGQYFANNSDFCPMLVTGLSGLYSSLPRRIIPPSLDWHAITQEDCVKIPDLQMFLNSVQFSNAVIQVAHPLVRNQLIHFIYSGFMVPVLAPALHQTSREGVTTATAYLDLFIRHITDPHLLKAVLKFVLMEKYDDVLILDSLLSRISSNSQLSTVTLALFHTLINLNCEDVMFQLVFRYLVPCTHVMVSQRKSVSDLDLYSKPAEKFLSLRPSCCTQALPHNAVPCPAHPPHLVGINTPFPTQRSSSNISPGTAVSSVVTRPVEAAVGLQPDDNSYFGYLHESRSKLERTAKACHRWSYLYDGESPPPDSIGTADKLAVHTESSKGGLYQDTAPNKNQDRATTGEIDSILERSKLKEENEMNCRGSSKSQVIFDQNPADINKEDCLFLARKKCTSELQGRCRDKLEPQLLASLDSLDSFLEYLNDLDLSGDEENSSDNQSVDEDIAALENLFRSISCRCFQRATSTSSDTEDVQCSFLSLTKVLSSNSKDTTEQCCSNNLRTTTHDLSSLQSTTSSRVALEISLSENQLAKQKIHLHPITSSFVDKTRVPNGNMEDIGGFIVESDEQLSRRTVDSSHIANVSLSSATTIKEQSVSKEFTAVRRSNLNPMKLPTNMSPFKSLLSHEDEFTSMTALSSPALKKLKYFNDPPNVGPFLGVLFARLDGMIGNSLYFNLLLTDVLSRLAAYPHPLLRSFLFSHNLVFQPSVKSFIQVLSSLRQKLDNFSLTVKHFDCLVVKARQNLVLRENQLLQTSKQQAIVKPGDSVFYTPKTPANATKTGHLFKGRMKVTLGDLIFRRSPGKEKVHFDKKKKNTRPQPVKDVGGGFTKTKIGSSLSSSNITEDSGNLHSLSTWNAVYCALILDEFLKELAALSQEHSVLHVNERV